jgi:hypothetical protein
MDLQEKCQPAKPFNMLGECEGVKKYIPHERNQSVIRI